jgi:hypothetical protein
MCRSVVGVVSTRFKAEKLVGNLQRAGFALPELSMLCPAAAEVALVGGASSGTLSLLAGIGAVALPGSEPLVAAGPLMSAVSGATAAAVGGIASALVGWGLPELEARRYQDCVSSGDILLAVSVCSREAERDAQTVFRLAGAHDVISARDTSDARGDEL